MRMGMLVGAIAGTVIVTAIVRRIAANTAPDYRFAKAMERVMCNGDGSDAYRDGRARGRAEDGEMFV